MRRPSLGTWALLLLCGCASHAAEPPRYRVAGTRVPAREPTGSPEQYAARIALLERELVARLGPEVASRREHERDLGVRPDSQTIAVPSPPGPSEAKPPPAMGAQAAATAPQDAPTSESAELAQHDADSPLSAALEAATESEHVTAPASSGHSRCRVAADLRDRICELTERICVIARKHGSDETLQRQCSGAQASCRKAARDVRDECGR